jgi:general secretion pathway protein J
MITRNNSSGGFTLIEVLIALAITALIATLSFTSLTTVLDSVESVREARTRITEVNRFWNLISRDLRQMVDRPVRNEFGEAEASFWGGADAENSLHFTRTGWHNPNDHTRSNMQRVAYRLEDETLWRDSYLVLDRTSETEPQSVALLEGVQLIEMVFMWYPGLPAGDRHPRLGGSLEPGHRLRRWRAAGSPGNPPGAGRLG